MKILILGARGMLGQALVQEFTSDELTAWDKDELDITDAEQVREKIAAEKPQVIINAAAYTAVDEAETNKELAFAVNAQAVGYIAAVARDLDATLVHYSTDYVFSGDTKGGYEEEDVPAGAINIYGESKLAGEIALRESGPRFYLVRTAWLYGMGGNNFVDTMAALAETKPELRVVNDQYGSPTYTVDVASATRLLLTGTKYSPGIYHSVNTGVATWYELAQEVLSLLGKSVVLTPVSTTEYPLPARRPHYSVLKNTKGPRMRSWQQALREYISQRMVLS